MESKRVGAVKLFFLGLPLLIVSCTLTNKNEEYELSTESCYAMKEDKSHRYWKQPIAVQGCELLISEHEMQNFRER